MDTKLCVYCLVLLAKYCNNIENILYEQLAVQRSEERHLLWECLSICLSVCLSVTLKKE